MTEAIEDVVDYLRTGGMGEVIGLTDLARQMKEPKVQMDTDMGYGPVPARQRGA
jgi:hypothetical protein